MFKGIIIVVLLAALLVLPGCWDRMELSFTTFPLVMGIDRDEPGGDYKLYVQIVRSASGSDGKEQKSFKTLEAQGKTLAEAMTKIADRSQQYISWKHISAVVISENLAKEGITEVMDLLSRFSQTRLTTLIFFTYEDLKKLLQGYPEADTGLSTPLSGVELVRQRTSQITAIDLKDFLIAHLSPGQDPVVPEVKIAASEKENLQLDFPGVGVFRGDRLVGRLDSHETRGLLWVQSKTNSGNLSIPCPAHSKEKIAINPIDTVTRISPQFQGNRLAVNVKVQTEFNLIELNCPISLSADSSKKIEQQAQAAIKDEIMHTITKAQKEFNADIFGFGSAVYRKYPSYWIKNKQRWPEIFSDLKVSLEVEAKLRRTGETTDSVMFQPKK